MADTVKTTLTFPEDLLQRAKITAVQEKTTLSSIVREGLEMRLNKPTLFSKPKRKVDLFRHLGVFKIGIKVPYKHRADLYDEHLRRKMGI